MKKHLLLILFSVITFFCFAQKPLFWGMTSSGAGTTVFGSIFKIDTAGTLTDANSFDTIGATKGSEPIGNLIKAGNGLLYGTTEYGGNYNKGTIFSYNISANRETPVYSFMGDSADGQHPIASLIQTNNDLLYGMTPVGGVYDSGTIFSYNSSTGIKTTLHSFMGTDGSTPSGNLMQFNDSLLYGMTDNGGIYSHHSFSSGILFSYNILTGKVTVLHNFGSGTDGYWPYGSLLKASNGLLYGMTQDGGVNSRGTIFSFDISTGIYADIHDFNYSDGWDPMGSLFQANDGLLYGMASGGGNYNRGTIFSYNITTGVTTKLHDFNIGTDAYEPTGTFIQASDGLLYAMTVAGGDIQYFGTVFTYNISTSTETVIHNFNGYDGEYPWGDLLEDDSTIIYATPLKANICQGDNVTIQVNGGANYIWSPSAGLSSTTGDSVIATPNITTTYTITGTANSQTDTTTIVVTVFPAPTITTSSTLPLCSGDSALLIATGAANYSWFPATALNVTTGDSVIANPTVTTIYTLTGTGVAGCPSTIYDSIKVNPITILTITPQYPSVCSGQSVSLKATGGANYTWNPATTLSSSTGDSVVANPTVTTVYSVTGTGTTGCTSTGLDSVKVNPMLLVNIKPLLPSFCYGDSIILTANGGANYTWSPTSGLNTTSGGSVIANPTNTTTYTIYASLNGCSDTGQIVVTVNPAPIISSTPSYSILCYGQSDTLTATGGGNYTWSPASGLNISIGSSVIATPNSNVTYIVSVTDSAGCSGHALDTITLLYGPNQPTITKNEDVLSSSATQGNQWIRNDSALQGATNQDYTVIISGWYKVIAENPANGCSTSSDSIYVSTLTNVNQLTAYSEPLTVYPNPTGGDIMVTISPSAINVKNWNLQITDVLGRLVYLSQSLNYSNEIDLSNLPAAMYFITVTNSRGRTVVPVVKVN